MNHEEKVKNNSQLDLKPETIKNESVLKKKWHVIKERFILLAQEVQCECFPKIFEEGHLAQKLIWTVFFLVFTGLTIYLITSNVLGYFRQNDFFHICIIARV